MEMTAEDRKKVQEKLDEIVHAATKGIQSLFSQYAEGLIPADQLFRDIAYIASFTGTILPPFEAYADPQHIAWCKEQDERLDKK